MWQDEDEKNVALGGLFRWLIYPTVRQTILFFHLDTSGFCFQACLLLHGEVSGAVITPFLSDPHASNTEITFFFPKIRGLWLLPQFSDALVENAEV